MYKPFYNLYNIKNNQGEVVATVGAKNIEINVTPNEYKKMLKNEEEKKKLSNVSLISPDEKVWLDLIYNFEGDDREKQ